MQLQFHQSSWKTSKFQMLIMSELQVRFWKFQLRWAQKSEVFSLIKFHKFWWGPDEKSQFCWFTWHEMTQTYYHRPKKLWLFWKIFIFGNGYWIQQWFPTFFDAFLPLFILQLFIPPYYINSAGWLERLKRHFCGESDRLLWVEVLYNPIVALLGSFNKPLLQDN